MHFNVGGVEATTMVLSNAVKSGTIYGIFVERSGTTIFCVYREMMLALETIEV
jgi:hypothetical protein